MPTEEEKWLKFHYGQYQFTVPFILYADFESILKPVDERYKEKMNRMKARRKDKASYTEKINTHVPSGMVMTLICSSPNWEGGLTRMMLESLQKTTRNTSVLMLKLT